MNIVDNKKNIAGISFWDFKFIIESCFNIDIYRYLNDEIKLTPGQERTLEDIINRYRQGDCLEYLVGKSNFFGLDLDINTDVLIPRPETEILVEALLRHTETKPDAKILEVGTGSGNICTAVGVNRPLSKIYSVDISGQALDLARQNIAKYGLKNVFLIHSSMFSCFKPDCFDVIVSNPPYVERGYLRTCRNLRYEPQIALDGGIAGCDFIRRIIMYAGRYLKNKGLLLFEIGYNHRQAVSRIIADSEFNLIEVIKDYAGIDRFILCSKAQAWKN